MQHYTSNDLLSLQLKYKNNQEVLDLISVISDQKSIEDLEDELSTANTTIEELEDTVSDLDDENTALQNVIDNIILDLSNLQDKETITKPDIEKIIEDSQN